MEKTKCVFQGRVVRKIYDYFRAWHNGEIKENFQDIGIETFYEKDFICPVFKTGERVYIDDLETIVEIKEIVRCLNGGLLLITDYKVKVIEDEETQKSLVKVLNEVERYKKETKDYERATKKNAEEKKRGWWK